MLTHLRAQHLMLPKSRHRHLRLADRTWWTSSSLIPVVQPHAKSLLRMIGDRQTASILLA